MSSFKNLNCLKHETLSCDCRKDRLQTAFFDDGVSTVKVDKNGQGLLKVWKQQLLQFKNISPDIADAIVQAYPSPHLLMEVHIAVYLMD